MNKKQLAFTLIELLVVIAVIGILSGLIVVSMSGVTNKATMAKSQVFNNSLRNALLLNVEGQWTLDGTPNDTWNNTTGTATGSPTSVTTDCPQGTCYSFSGSGQYITTPNASLAYTIGTNPMAAMVWVKGNSQVSKAIFANWDTTAAYKGAWKIGTGSTGTLLNVVLADTTTQANTKNSTTTAVVFDNFWHLVGFSWSGGGGSLSVYVDGAVAAVTTANGGTGTVASLSANGTASAPISIAADVTSSVASNLFTGSIDDARLYSAAVPTGMFREIYYSGLNNLFAKGEITQSEYVARIAEVSLK